MARTAPQGGTINEGRSLPGHVDVLIVGAGLSGLGVASHLTMKQPGRTFAIIDGRDAIGGTLMTITLFGAAARLAATLEPDVALMAKLGLASRALAVVLSYDSCRSVSTTTTTLAVDRRLMTR